MIDRDRGELVILDSPEAVAQRLADEFIGIGRDAIRERGKFFVALAGGTTPKAAYALLAQEPRRSAIDWKAIMVFFGDERCVPPDDDRSNYHTANAGFLSQVGIPPENVFRMRGEDEPAQAARAYAETLVELMGTDPRFDLIMLGMGADGHTASLFPGSDPLTGDEQLVRAPYVEKMQGYRITLTPKVINAARRVVIATEGLPKAPALYAVLRGPYEPTIHPIQIVAPASGSLTWLVDSAAAAELS